MLFEALYVSNIMMFMYAKFPYSASHSAHIVLVEYCYFKSMCYFHCGFVPSMSNANHCGAIHCRHLNMQYSCVLGSHKYGKISG